MTTTTENELRIAVLENQQQWICQIYCDGHYHCADCVNLRYKIAGFELKDNGGGIEYEYKRASFGLSF